MFIALYINLAIYNKLEHNNVVEIVNKPFLNLVYLYMGFYKTLIKKHADDLDRGDNIYFPKEHYNYFRTRDNKYISIGNLEPKFQENFKKTINKINQEDIKSSSNPNEENYQDSSRFEYNIDNVSNVFQNHNRDEIFVKVFFNFN